MGELIDSLSVARIGVFRDEVARRSGRSRNDIRRGEVESLYIWQTSIAAAWYETIALFEPLLRNRLDTGLRQWNTQRGHSPDWLDDPASPLKGLVHRMALSSRKAADTAAKRRAPMHPRHGVRATIDDRVAQLSFGNLAALFPQDPPAHRNKLASGFTAYENLWLHGLSWSFPGLSQKFVTDAKFAYGFKAPNSVEPAYAIGNSLESLRRLRNRVSHQEQILYVDHSVRLKELYGLTHAMAPQSLGLMKRLDRVQRTLALRPQY